MIVLWISLGLASLALYFGQSMKLEYRASANTAAGLQAAQAIEGAQRYLRYALTNLVEVGATLDPTLFTTECVAVDEAHFWVVGRNGQDSTGQALAFGLVAEAGKLNLNKATREMLEALPGMTAELAGAIMDWKDKDEEISSDGAEAETYALRDVPMQCKNGPFETIEELRLIEGVEWDILFGEDANLNGALDPNEDDADLAAPADDQNGVLAPGILEYLTVYSREPNKKADGSNRVNLNNPSSLDSVRRVLEQALGASRTEEIKQALKSGKRPYGSVLEFSIWAGLTPDELAQIEDSLTVNDGARIDGRINVNVAPAAVLACVPGIGESAQALVDYRGGKTADELASVAWITQVLESSAAIKAGPYVTTHCYQYSADIAAVGAGGQGLRRELFVFDTSQGQASVLYRRDRSRLGWPLGQTIREELASNSLEEEGQIP